jgi:hypothetical protein
MNKHSIAQKYFPIALALAAFTAAGTAPAVAQQSGRNAGISTRNAQPFVHKQYGVAVPSSVERLDPFGVDGWFNR